MMTELLFISKVFIRVNKNPDIMNRKVGKQLSFSSASFSFIILQP